MDLAIGARKVFVMMTLFEQGVVVREAFGVTVDEPAEPVEVPIR